MRPLVENPEAKTEGVIVGTLVGVSLFFFVTTIDPLLTRFFYEAQYISVLSFAAKTISLEKILIFGIATPILEEFLFRKLLPAILQKAIPYKLACYLSLLIFIAAHNRLFGTVFIFNIAALGISCTILKNNYGNLIPPIACHGIYNTLGIIPRPSLLEIRSLSLTYNEFTYLILAPSSVIFLAILLYFILRSYRAKNAKNEHKTITSRHTKLMN